MKVSTFLAAMGAVAILFGLEFLLVPEFALKQYGVPTEAHNLMQGRYFGGTLLAFGVILWLARGTRDGAAVRALLLGSVVGNLVGVVLSAWSGMAGLQNAMAWLSVVLYGVFLLGALYLLSTSRKSASPVSA